MNNDHDSTPDFRPEYDALILAIVTGILIGMALLFYAGMGMALVWIGLFG